MTSVRLPVQNEPVINSAEFQNYIVYVFTLRFCNWMSLLSG